MCKIKEYLNSIVNNNTIIKDIIICDYKCTILYHKELSNIPYFYENFIDKINRNNIDKLDEYYPGLINRVTEINYNLTNVSQTGNILIYFEEKNILYEIILRINLDRNITTSIIDPLNLYGSQDGFIENIEKNYSLIKKRIKSNNLYNEEFIIGTRTQTRIYLSYISDLISYDDLSTIRETLLCQNVDSVLSYNDIANLFNKNNLFPLIGTTSSPEIASEHLLQGRILLLIDNSPVVIALPFTLKAHTFLKDENSSPIYYSIYNRILTFFMIFLAVFFLGLYVAIINYHSRNLSLIVISEIKVTARGTTVPLFVEILLLLLMFEFLKLGSIKTPSTNIQNVIIIVGGLLIGQNLVNSGFIGAFNFVITAICFLCTFGISNNQHLIIATSILRFIILVFGFLLGIYGFVIAFLLILIYLIKTKSLSSYYLSPIIPTLNQPLLRVILPKAFFTKKIRTKNTNLSDSTAGGTVNV